MSALGRHLRALRFAQPVEHCVTFIGPKRRHKALPNVPKLLGGVLYPWGYVEKPAPIICPEPDLEDIWEEDDLGIE